MMPDLRKLPILVLTLILSNCIATQNPLADVEIPVPANAEPSFYFFRGAQAIFYKQEAKLSQAKDDLELVISVDETIQFPEAYPLLVECYQRLGIIDSAGWIYTEALFKFESSPAIKDSHSTSFQRWQASYPEFPAEFLERDYRLLDSGPEAVGGYGQLYHNLKYPEMARSMNRSGTSYFSFMVHPDGSISDLKLIKSSYPDLDESAKTAITKTAWIPAKYRGKPVSFQMILPIVFRL